MFISVDGFITGSEGEFDDYEPSAEEAHFANEFFGLADGIVFGRVTYEGFISYWDSLDLTDPSIPKTDIEFAGLFKKKARIVISRTLEQVGPNTIHIKEDIAREIWKLKQTTDHYFVLICGPELLATLIELGLVDEYRLLVKPRAFGRGKAMFANITKKLPLKLLSTRVFESGTVMLHYEVAKE